jgi:hypothetical protein
MVNLVRAQNALLHRDAPAALGLPLPHALHEGLAPQIVAGLALALELALHYGLCSDAGVVDTRLPERVEAAHAVVTDERVLQRAPLRVTHVQGAGHVGRGHGDDVDRPLVDLRVRGGEYPLLFPERVPALFDLARVVRLLKIGVHRPRLADHFSSLRAFSKASFAFSSGSLRMK